MNYQRAILELYCSYLLTQTHKATATGLSQMTNGEISHDKISRFLQQSQLTSKGLWVHIKKFVRKQKNNTGNVLILDDTIQEKPYTKENAIVCWHYDHAKQKTVKGVNILTCMFANQEQSLPVGYEIVEKTVSYKDKKTGKIKRKSQETKNEKFRQLILQACKNSIQFNHVLADSWYCSKKNMNYISKLGKKFVFAIESNRFICFEDLIGTEKQQYLQLRKVDLQANRAYSVRVKGVDFPLTLMKKIFKNGDGSVGTLYLVTNDLTLDSDAIYTIYKRRWKIEEYHRSIKQNVSLAKSPCWKEKTQRNHIFLVLIAFSKLEMLKLHTNLNHYQLRNRFLLKANIAAYEELIKIQKTVVVPA